MPNASGLIRVYKNVLTLTPAATALSAPLTAYGNIGVNDSGMIYNETLAFSKYTVQMEPADAYTVTVYGTVDKRAKDLYEYNLNPNPYLTRWQGVAPTLPASSWFIMPSPAEQSGAGTVSNPMVTASPIFTSALPVMAIRCVLTAIGSPTNQVTVSVLAAG